MNSETVAGREPGRDVGGPDTSTATTTAKAGAQAAADGARDVTQTAKEEARAVASEVSTQARRVAGDLREQVRDRAQQQHGTMVTGLRRAADELRDMSGDRADSPARNLVTSLADRTHRFADELDKRGPEGVLTEVQDFARRRPGTFLLAAAAAGFVVGRVGKSVFSAPNSPLSGGGGAQDRPAGPGSSAAAPIPDGGEWTDPALPPAAAEGTVYSSGSAAGEPPQVELVPPVPPGPVPSSVPGSRP
jgi:hypothetical protein